MPLAVNPAPDTVTCEIVTLLFPVLLREIDCEPLALPTSTFPKLKLVTLGESRKVCAVPLPDNAMVVGEFVALLVTVMLPVMLPATVGEKPAVSDALCPAARVNGTVIPLTVNPAPDTATCEIVTLLFPVLMRETDCELLVLPTRMLPKLKLLILGDSRKVCATPVPDRAIVVGELVALLTAETLPVSLPAAAGEKATVNVAACPSAKVKGVVTPLTVNPAPVTDTCETVRLPLPVFDSTTLWVLLPPTSTLPRLSEVALGDSTPVDAGVGAAETPVPDTATVLPPRASRLQEMEILPEKVPALVGANTTRKEAPCPALRVSGSVGPVTSNWLLLLATFSIVTFCDPVFVTVKPCALLAVSTVTDPKLNEEGLSLTAELASRLLPHRLPRITTAAGHTTSHDLLADFI